MKRMLIAAAVIVSTLCAGVAAAQTAPRAGAPAPTQNPPARPAAPATQAPALPTQQAQPAATPQPPPPFPAGGKIAFVNMQLVVSESKLGKSGQDKLKKLHDGNQVRITQLAKNIQDQQTKMNTQAGVVSESALQAMKRDLDRMQLELQSEQQKAQAEEQNTNEDLLTDFSQKAVPIIDALRAEKELWFILGVQEGGDGAGGQLIVVSVNPGLDLSQEVIKRLDAKFPG